MELDFSIDGQLASKLFSIQLLIDKQLCIHEIGSVLSRHMPEIVAGSLLTEVFEVHRPATVTSPIDILGKLDELFLMSARSGRFAVRGQFVHAKSKNEEMMVFLGAPWLQWIHAKFPDEQLELSDFATQDTQLDQLLMMSTSTRMIADLEELNDELKEAKLVADNAHQARVRFFNQMSHELRTPLNGVASALTLLSECMLESDASDLVRLADRSAQHMVKVVNQVLDTSAVESSPQKEQPTWFGLQALLTDVSDIVRPRSVEKNLELIQIVDPTLDPWVHGQRDNIHQALLNLLINAVKYTETGSVTLCVKPVMNPTPETILRFEVVDTGVGISAENIEHIFTPFWKLQSSNRVYEAGSGLGLHIVNTIVEALNGELGVESTGGRGSRFWMDLPVSTASQRDFVRMGTSARGEVPVATHADSSSMVGRILLVDDNSTNLSLGRMLIKSISQDLEVDVVATGEEAIDSMCNKNYELIFMDLNLPDVQGREAVVAAARVKGSDMPPVIALTAHTDDNERRLCAEVGMVDFLVKPLSKENLCAAISSHMITRAEQAAPPVVLDTTILEALTRDLGDDLLQQVVSEFVNEVEGKRSTLDAGMGHTDLLDIAATAHFLASSCKSFGLTEVGNDLLELERRIKSSDDQDVHPQWTEITKRLDQGISALVAWTN